MKYFLRLSAVKVIRFLVRNVEARERPHVTPLETTYHSHGKDHRLDIYTPLSSDLPKALLPIVINFHGSGFCLPSLGADAVFCGYIAKEVNCVVLDADYSKAPERPWPNAVDDVDEVIKWAKQHAEARGWDPDRMAICGFSAGGALALVGASSPQGRELKAVVAFYASTDLAEPPSHKPNVRTHKRQAGVNVNAPLRRLFYNCYLPPPIDRSNPRVSALYASPESFPPSVTLITCTGCALARESNKLGEKLKDTCEVVSYAAEGQGHAWDKYTKEGSKGRQYKDEAYELVAKQLKAALWPSDKA